MRYVYVSPYRMHRIRAWTVSLEGILLASFEGLPGNFEYRMDSRVNDRTGFIFDGARYLGHYDFETGRLSVGDQITIGPDPSILMSQYEQLYFDLGEYL